MALSRPDISHNMLVRKQDVLTLAGNVTQKPPSRILTNCPSCVQGLGRLTGVTPVHLAEALAEAMGGRLWKNKRLDELTRSREIVTF
jgi:Fe-S oxidoreductase